jgi:uncharacterized membrane protein
MRRSTTGAAVVAAAVAATAIARNRKRAGTPAARGTAGDRWHSVTINRTPEEVGALPDALAALGNTIEVRIRPAPAGRGTELAARIRDEVPTGLDKVAAKLTNEDPVRRLRRALREAKQIAEVGEVLLPDDQATTRRTLTSRPLEYATRHGREEGRL